MKSFLSSLGPYANALQAVLALVAIVTTSAVAYFGYRVSELQTRLLALDHLPAITVRLDPALTEAADPEIVPVVVENMNTDSAARELEHEFHTFLRIFVIGPGTGEDLREVLLYPASPYLFPEETGLESGELLRVLPSPNGSVQQAAEAATRRPYPDLGDEFRVVDMGIVSYLKLGYLDLLGNRHEEHFKIGTPRGGASRVGQDEFQRAEDAWRATGEERELGELTGADIEEWVRRTIAGDLHPMPG